MKIVGLTGGIGSGKTTVINLFKELGVPTYISDFEAKKLMNSSEIIKTKLIDLLGSESYMNGELNRSYLRSRIFNNKHLLKSVNAIVHPEVKLNFETWLENQNSDYIIKESAIIFENNLQHQFDYIIAVVADIDLRIERVMKRDDKTKAQVQEIIKNQLPEDVVKTKSDFIITNNDISLLKKQVVKIHNCIISHKKI